MLRIKSLRGLIIAFGLAVHTIAQHQGSNVDKQIEEVYKSCKESTANCFGLPLKCEANPIKCKSLTTVALNPENKKFMFTVLGSQDHTSNQHNDYTAVGVAKSGKNMEKTIIFVCSHGKLEPFWSAEIGVPSKIYTKLDYFHSTQIASENEKVFCKFEIDSRFQEHKNAFDLYSDKTAILVASGQLANSDGTPGKHKPEDRHLFEPRYLSKNPENPGNSSPSFSTSSMLFTAFIAMLVKIW